jgi:hypothetical protein
VLGLLRFTTVALLALLLLKPFFKQTTEEVQKPVIAVLSDNSESVMLKTDSNLVTKLYQEIDQISGAWENDVNVDWINFGASVRLADNGQKFSDQTTDIASALKYVDDTYAGINLGAVILISDGIFNTGRHPLYINLAIKAPIYTLALGDTSISKDLNLVNTFANKISYLGDKVEIQVDVSATNLDGQRSSIRIINIDDNTNAAPAQVVDIDNTSTFETLSFIVEPQQAGVARYRIIADPLPKEEDRRNNYRDVYIEVLDSRQKILLIADAPHPDLGAISSLLSLKRTKEVEFQLAKEYNGNFNGYDLVIFHQIPGNDPAGRRLLDKWSTTNVPALFILGSQSDVGRFNSVQSSVKLEGANGQMNEVQAYKESSFTLFSIDQEIIDLLPILPPLYSPFGEYTVDAGSQAILSQKIGDIQSGYPLLVFSEADGKKMGVFTAEGIWRWRLFNFLEKENFEAVAGLMEKVTQYLAVKSDKRRFRLDIKKNVYNTNESVEFSAELYNAAYERINQPDIEMVIRDEDGNTYEYVFDKAGNRYLLDAGRFGDGAFRYTASTVLDGEERTISGRFSVEPIQLESYRTTADHNLLQLLSNKYNGELFYPDELAQLDEQIKSSDALKPVYYSTTQNAPAIDLKAILFLLLALLSVEWFIRKYLGSY